MKQINVGTLGHNRPILVTACLATAMMHSHRGDVIIVVPSGEPADLNLPECSGNIILLTPQDATMEKLEAILSEYIKSHDSQVIITEEIEQLGLRDARQILIDFSYKLKCTVEAHPLTGNPWPPSKSDKHKFPHKIIPKKVNVTRVRR